MPGERQDMGASDHEVIERHADLILKSAGSALRHYTLPGSRAAIIEAVMECYLAGFRAGSGFVIGKIEEAATPSQDHQP